MQLAQHKTNKPAILIVIDRAKLQMKINNKHNFNNCHN